MFDTLEQIDEIHGPREPAASPVFESAAWTDLDDSWLETLTQTERDTATDTGSPVSPVEVGLVLDLVGQAVLSRIELASGLEVIARLQAQARLVSTVQAGLLEAINRIVDEYQELSGDPALAHEGAVAEIRAALSLTRRAAESDLDLATSLRDRTPQVLEALRAGRIDLRRAWVLVDETSHLDPDTANEVAGRVLDRVDGRTTGQLKSLVRRLCIDFDPDTAHQRHQSALTERKVVAELGPDSTSTITASDLPPDRVAQIMDRLTRIAHTLRKDGEHRTIDQLRADIFLDLLEGNTSSKIHGTIDIRVDLTTLTGLNDRAAELNGWGPVIADIARHVTSRIGPTWQITASGSADNPTEAPIVDQYVTRRRPTTTTRRLVEAKDPTCIFPGCRRPSTQCDLDHRIPVADGGPTHPDNLAPLCRHDHRIRHQHGWTHTPTPNGGHQWTSPLGNHYTRPPPA